MHLSQLSFPSLATGVLCVCRAAGLLALLALVSGGILGAAVSLHMAQVFDRVTSVHAAAVPFLPDNRSLVARTSL